MIYTILLTLWGILALYEFLGWLCVVTVLILNYI